MKTVVIMASKPCCNSLVVLKINAKRLYATKSVNVNEKSKPLTSSSSNIGKNKINNLSKEIKHLYSIINKKLNLSNSEKKSSLKTSEFSDSDKKSSLNTSELSNFEKKSSSIKLEISSCDEKNSLKGSKIKSSHRLNEVKIQMLPEKLHTQIFGKRHHLTDSSEEVVKKLHEELKKQGLLGNKIEALDEVDIDLPLFEGENIEEHFQVIGKEQSEPYKNLVNNFVNKGIPKTPDSWLKQKGWTKYVTGQPPVKVPFPEEDALVFDVEVCVKLGDLPTLATAVSEVAWYGWVGEDLSEGIDALPTQYYSTEKLISIEGDSVNKDKPRIVIGHNISYDRARMKEQYYLDNSAMRFLDTMSLHICIGGLTKTQKDTLKKNVEEDTIEAWRLKSCLSSLKDVYFLYCNKKLCKDNRNIFLEGTLKDISDDFQKLMNYCAEDVKATYEVVQSIFPVFLERFPHPVTLAGMLEMSTAYLPVNSNWQKFLTEADQTYDDLKHEMSLILSKKGDNACRLFHEDKYKNDLWMWNEDWSTQELKLTKKKLPAISDPNNISLVQQLVDEEEKLLDEKFKYLFDLEGILPARKPFLPGYPSWYRKLCDKSDPIVNLTTSMLIAPKLLRLTWENYPLYHTKEYGWGILVADIYAKNVASSLPFESIKKLTLKNCSIDPNKVPMQENHSVGIKNNSKASPPSYYKGSGVWCDYMVDDCCYFFKLPHRDGSSKNVGNPLSRTFSQLLYNNNFSCLDASAKKVIDLGMKISYWRNNRERLWDQMVVWLSKKECLKPMPKAYVDDDKSVGVILPKVVVCGTLTRRAMESTWLTASKSTHNRIGSELRALVQAPPGYHIVGADVDSQELWIASLIGDSFATKIHGATPFGWMTLSGTKANETDMHSVTAKAIGISREHAKVINYARIYGAGTQFATKLLQQFNPVMTDKEATSKILKMYSLTKGTKIFKVKPKFKEVFLKKFGTTEIATFVSAIKAAKILGKKLDEVYERPVWINGTESAMFNKLESFASAWNPVTPFLSCRLSSALEPRFEGDDYHMNTRINWVVQSGAVDFLHLMLVCMRWLTKGQARYCFSFHDEVRYLLPSEYRYSGALALHITNLLVRSFCAHRLGMYDLPFSVAFFSSVEIDKALRKEADDDCISPSNPHGMEKGYGIPPGESLDIYETIKKAGRSLSNSSWKYQVFFMCVL